MRQTKPTTIHFTQAGYDKAKADFERLTALRKEVLVRLQAAREMGDLSENGAYHAAKFELGSIDRQLRRLTYQLQYGQVMEAEHNGAVNFGNKVTLTNQGKSMTFTLVNGYESNPKEQKLSVISPMGKSVLGKKVGDTVVVKAPAGDQVFVVKKIE